MDRLVKNAVVLSLLVLTPVLIAQAPRPRGVYTKVEISKIILAQQQANPAIMPAQLDAYFINLYQDLLSKPAVSGLEISVHWGQVNPTPPTSTNPYCWNYLDDGFNQAAAWNAQNPTQAPRTIQLLMDPGFNSPQWMLDQIPNCDGLFQSPVQTRQARAERQPSWVTRKAAIAPSFRCRGIRSTRAPGAHS
jgi:hypothetical protein